MQHVLYLNNMRTANFRNFSRGIDEFYGPCYHVLALTHAAVYIIQRVKHQPQQYGV